MRLRRQRLRDLPLFRSSTASAELSEVGGPTEGTSERARSHRGRRIAVAATDHGNDGRTGSRELAPVKKSVNRQDSVAMPAFSKAVFLWGIAST